MLFILRYYFDPDAGILNMADDENFSPATISISERHTEGAAARSCQRALFDAVEKNTVKIAADDLTNGGNSYIILFGETQG